MSTSTSAWTGIAGEDGAFRSNPDRRRAASYHARKIVLATGYYDLPNRLNVPGEDLDKVSHYYKEPHPYYDHDVVVVGGKNSAAIAALELCRTGARVTLIHRGGEISNRVKYWIKPDIENRIKNGEVHGLLQLRVLEIKEESLSLATPQGEIELNNDFVFAHDRLPPRYSSSSRATASTSTRPAPPHRPGNTGERSQRHLPRRSDRRRHAHQRDLHRERPTPALM